MNVAKPTSVHDYQNPQLAAENMLSTAEYLLKALEWREGYLAPDQVRMLAYAVERVRAAKRAATSLTDI